MKIYRAHTPQILALTKILQNFSKTITPQESLSFSKLNKQQCNTSWFPTVACAQHPFPYGVKISRYHEVFREIWLNRMLTGSETCCPYPPYLETWILDSVISLVNYTMILLWTFDISTLTVSIPLRRLSGHPCTNLTSLEWRTDCPRTTHHWSGGDSINWRTLSTYTHLGVLIFFFFSKKNSTSIIWFISFPVGLLLSPRVCKILHVENRFTVRLCNTHCLFT